MIWGTLLVKVQGRENLYNDIPVIEDWLHVYCDENRDSVVVDVFWNKQNITICLLCHVWNKLVWIAHFLLVPSVILFESDYILLLFTKQYKVGHLRLGGSTNCVFNFYASIIFLLFLVAWWQGKASLLCMCLLTENCYDMFSFFFFFCHAAQDVFLSSVSVWLSVFLSVSLSLSLSLSLPSLLPCCLYVSIRLFACLSVAK